MEVAKEESVLSKVLDLTMREEKIRQDLPTLEASLEEMKAKRAKLIEEQKELDKKVS